ncbi:unnamed protein product [Ostreobium quekettii]|uniref:RING-type E3 ubiquitin transferase n=1 Tax=Ostreobium quekettii TaxID=121088 RepID=A0A8S1ITN8_9CHLO|nr:unnamed protein product [Ostreobium quekettii]|eukprot:evm.model.scf_936.1 EVM.evm.TU.scf_936.1   scf_936:26502-27071(+)
MATESETAAQPRGPTVQGERLPVGSLEGEDAFEESSPFECNICLDLAKDPVVTLCGHLYCWPCLFRWNQSLQSQAGGNNDKCPVCKANMDVSEVIPIYCRQAEGQEAPEGRQPLPPRPAGQRPKVAARSLASSFGVGQSSPQPGFLGLLIGINGGGHGSAMTPEQQHQAFLSRLLLLLGSFVILCLLLF